MTVEKQDGLGKWINKDFIELKTIYKDKTSIEQNAYWMIFQ
ncbi:hypothetical protein [Clostridium magnum]|nr:hypothetical protein [Clostridium magnum]